MFGDTEPPEEHTHNLLVVQVTSKGFDDEEGLAQISLNDKPVMCQRNETGHYRGLHIVILNPQTG